MAFALGILLPSSILFYFGLILNSSVRKCWVFLSGLVERVYWLTISEVRSAGVKGFINLEVPIPRQYLEVVKFLIT